MASPCCPPGSWGPLPDNGYTHKGSYEQITTVDCYAAGVASSAKAVILSFSDVMPCLSDRKREVCDQLAEAIPDSCVIAPDFFRGNPIIQALPPDAGKFRSILGLLTQTPGILYRMRYTHNWGVLGPMLEGLVAELRQRHPDAHFLCYGYCFGGWVVCKCCDSMGFSAGVSFHPSPQVAGMQPAPYKQTLEQLAKAVACPVLLLPAGNDPDLVKPGGDFVGWLPEGSLSHTYERMSHGYMSRGVTETGGMASLMKEGPEEVAEDQADALKRTVEFFKSALAAPPVPATGPRSKL